MWSIEVMLRKSENSWERLKTSMEHLKTSDIILRKCLHRGWLCIAQGVVMHKSYNQAENIRKQQRTSENSWLHQKTSKCKIIWYHPENNWGPTIDSLVQFEEDFNSRTKKWIRWGYIRPDQFLDHLTVIKTEWIEQLDNYWQFRFLLWGDLLWEAGAAAALPLLV